MKKVLEFIEAKQQEFAQRPLFEFMKNRSIPPKQRLAFVPQMSYFIMSFGDFNKYFLRQEPTNDSIQKLVNQYSREDDDHWNWFLRDLEVLGFNYTASFVDVLKFLWGEETKSVRQLTYKLTAYALHASPIQKVVLAEAVEATSHIFFDLSYAISLEMEELFPKESLHFFGQVHHDAEASHTSIGGSDSKEVEKIQFSEDERQEAFELVEKVFECFNDHTDEMLSYAKKYPLQKSLSLVEV